MAHTPRLRNAADATFTAQAQSSDGMEVVFSVAAPGAFDQGLIIKQGDATSREDGGDNVYARPFKRPGVDRKPGAVAVVLP